MILWLCLFILAVAPGISAQEYLGQVSIYLDRFQNAESSIELQFRKISLEADGSSQALAIMSPQVSLADPRRRQVLLAQATVEPGEYRTLALSVSGVVKAPETDSMQPNSLPDAKIPINLTVKPGEAEILFLHCSQSIFADSGKAVQLQFREVRKKIPPLNSLAFLSNEASHNVLIIDRISGEIVGGISVGQFPRGMVIAARSGLLFVTNSQSNTLSVIDIQTQQLNQVVNLDFNDEPEAVCLSLDERWLFVADRGSNSVSAIDRQTLNLTRKISVGLAPVDIETDPVSGQVYVINNLSDNVSIFNPTDLNQVSTLSVGSAPTAVEFDDRHRIAFISNSKAAQITQIDTDKLTVLASLHTDRSVTSLAMDEFSGNLYCAVHDYNCIAVLRPALNIEMAEIPLGTAPGKLTWDPENAYLYVTCPESNEVIVINKTAGRIERFIAAGLKPYMIVFP